MTEEWQRKWTRGETYKKDSAPVGRNTHKWIPTVSIKSYNVTKETVQLITNHGSFGEYLKRFNIAVDTTCYCGEDSSNADHILTSCLAHSTHTIRGMTQKFQDWRQKILQDENLMKELENLSHTHIVLSRQHHDKTIKKNKKTGKRTDPIAKIITQTKARRKQRTEPKTLMRDIRSYL